MFKFFLLHFIFCSCLTSIAQIKKIKAHYRQADKIAKNIPITFIQPSMNLVDHYDELQQIILVRHGEPEVNKKGWFTRTEAIRFIKNYDSVNVIPLPFTPVTLYKNEISTIHTSTVHRAKHTARLLFGDCINYQENDLFREFERKIISFPNIKMPLKFWLYSSRFFWLMGGNKKNIESYKEARKRVKEASEKLCQYASEEKKVVLVAHGFLNRQIIKNLKKQGWFLVRKGGNQYLAASLLVKIEK